MTDRTTESAPAVPAAGNDAPGEAPRARGLAALPRRVRRGWQLLGHAWRCRRAAARAMDEIRRARAADGAGPRRRVAIALIEHFGDIVACEPVARQVRARSPGARIAWLVRDRYRSLLDHNPNVDDVVPAECLCVTEIILRRAAFDEVVNLHADGRKCAVRLAPLRKPSGDPRITVDTFYEHGGLLRSFSLAAGIPPVDDAPRVHVPAAARESVDRLGLPPRIVVFHCVAEEASRNWQGTKWRRLAELVRGECGVPVAEVGLASALAAAGTADFIDLCGRLSLLETAEVVRRAALFVGIDSGPAHLANAAGVEGVILIGRYKSFEGHVPYSGAYAAGGRADLVRSPGPASGIEVEDVMNAVRRRLGVR